MSQHSFHCFLMPSSKRLYDIYYLVLLAMMQLWRSPASHVAVLLDVSALSSTLIFYVPQTANKHTNTHRGRHIKIIGGPTSWRSWLPSPFPSLPLFPPSPTLLLPSPLPLPPFPPSPSSPLFPPLPSPPLEVGPLFAARGCGGALKLPHRVLAEPGRQTFSGAF